MYRKKIAAVAASVIALAGLGAGAAHAAQPTTGAGGGHGAVAGKAVERAGEHAGQAEGAVVTVKKTANGSTVTTAKKAEDEGSPARTEPAKPGADSVPAHVIGKAR
ncbi:hypothetical protein [Streptomyces boninensis]|uniref:hypothetical protein n=1 Tax=Streptomyces boninensis TaxID=2039455 RepID=UPI003B21B875